MAEEKPKEKTLEENIAAVIVAIKKINEKLTEKK